MEHPQRPGASDDFWWWALGDNPLWLDFSEPTLLNLDTAVWNQDRVVVSKNGTDDTWVYLVVTGPPNSSVLHGGRSFFPVAHPVCFCLDLSTYLPT